MLNLLLGAQCSSVARGETISSGDCSVSCCSLYTAEESRGKLSFFPIESPFSHYLEVAMKKKHSKVNLRDFSIPGS